MTDSTPAWVKTAKTGDNIVCVTGHQQEPNFPLVKGDIYTISEIYSDAGFIYVVIEEYDFPHLADNVEYSGHSFGSRHFRPVTKTKSTTKAVAELKRMAKDLGKVDA